MPAPVPTLLRGRIGTRTATGAVIGGFAVLRVAYLLTGRPASNADEAVTGIMVERILHGQDFVYYAGQPYGGTIEQYVQAALYLVTRLPRDLETLRLVQVAMSIATCALVLAVARRLLSPRRAIAAGVLFALGPWFGFLAPGYSWGFYAVGPLLGTLSCWAALRSRRSSTWWSLLSGVAGGLALYSSVSMALLVLPALMWAAWRARAAAVWLGAAVLGASPALLVAASTGRLPVPPTQGPQPDIATRLGALIDPVLREFVGVARGHGRPLLPLPVQWTVVGLVALTYLLACRRVVARRRARPLDVLLLVPVLAVLSFAASPSAAYTGAPRYLLAAYPLYAIALAAALPRGARRGALVGGLVVLGVGGLGATYLAGHDLTASRPPATDLRQTVRLLDARGIRTVYADYWTAMPLEYGSRERVRAGVYGGVVRFPSDLAAADADARVTYVASTADGTWTRLAAALSAAGLHGRTTRVGTLVVVDDLPDRARPRYLLHG